ncbi:hypothetical protein Tco_1404487, partial [Tanacetum coccineum]
TDTKNFTEEINTNFKLLIVKLELVYRRILDLGKSKPKLLHVDLRNISCDKKFIVAWRQLEDIQNNLICGFDLLLCRINSHVAQSNLDLIIKRNQCLIQSILLYLFLSHDSAQKCPV